MLVVKIRTHFFSSDNSSALSPLNKPTQVSCHSRPSLGPPGAPHVQQRKAYPHHRVALVLACRLLRVQAPPPFLGGTRLLSELLLVLEMSPSSPAAGVLFWSCQLHVGSLVPPFLTVPNILVFLCPTRTCCCPHMACLPGAEASSPIQAPLKAPVNGWAVGPPLTADLPGFLSRADVSCIL